MNNYNDITNMMKSLEGVFGFDPSVVSQGSDEWHTMKMGVISASNASKVISEPRSKKAREAGEMSEGALSYMANLIGQVCTGMHDEINSYAMDWGKEWEDSARSAYELISGNDVQQISFAFKDVSMRVGCSPDGLIKGMRKGVEIKCPLNSENHIKALMGVVKPEYIKQVNFSMWCLGLETWDFVSYDHRMKKKMVAVQTFKADEDLFKEFDKKVPLFIEEMDDKLKSIGVEFGEQWQK